MQNNNIILNFTDFGNREWKDHLKGGKADDKTPEDFDKDNLIIGTSVEKEHTNNPDLATEISMDHSIENDTYYDELIMSGIADEKDAIDLYNDIKSKEEKEFIINKLQNHLDKEKEKLEEDDEEDDYDDDIDDLEEDDYEEDDLGTDKTDYDENDELLMDYDNELKNKNNIMEKSKLKNYNLFINEQSTPEKTAKPEPERKFSKENKYKFQLSYNKKIADKLNDYNFTHYVPDGEKEQSSPSEDNHFIVIDTLNLTYSIVDHETPDIRFTDPRRLKNILENL